LMGELLGNNERGQTNNKAALSHPLSESPSRSGRKGTNTPDSL
jgi:hypothetical protein